MFIFIAFSMCNICRSEDEMKTVLEGASVHLHYPYPCNSTRVTLQYGFRAPFYTLADTESIVLPFVQEHRFNFKNESEDDHCSLHVRINPVMRTDAGTYIFFVYSEEGLYEDPFKRIGLDVEFLPGKASCTMGKENTVGNWVVLNCIALVGSLSGQIDCYQNGEKMPPLTEPIETLKHLKQNIYVNKKHIVFCCTSTWEHTKDLCGCNDWLWDLANDKNLSSVIDPCGPTTSVQEQTQTSETAFIPSSNATSVSTDGTILKINYSNVSVKWKYAVPILSSVFIIGLVIPVILFMLRYKQKTSRITAKICTHEFTSQDQIPYKHEDIANPRENQCMIKRSISV